MKTEQTIKLTTSELRQEAERFIAGGVVSLNRKVTPDIIFTHGKGSKIFDTEGIEYIDYHAAFAPHFLGHNDPDVTASVVNVLRENRSLMGTGTNELEVTLARVLCEMVSSLESIQIANTGTEGTAHAIRLSRAFTGREDIILTLGGYNGWHNEVSRAVSPALESVGPRVSPGEYPFVPLSAGIPASTKRLVHVVNFNDLDSIEYVMRRFPVACVLTEPVLQNVGVILPRQGYLQGIVDLCRKYGAVSIFDEVKTGFRSAPGGYQSVADVKPDLSVFGKAVANGYPMGIIGGKREIMNLFDSPDPAKRVLIAGTYNAHPVNVAAALATLRKLRDGNVYGHVKEMSDLLYEGLRGLFAEKGMTISLASNASAFCLYFMDHLPVDLHDILLHHNSDLDLRMRRELIKHGIYHIPLPYKQGSVSFAHSREDISKTLEVTRNVLKTL